MFVSRLGIFFALMTIIYRELDIAKKALEDCPCSMAVYNYLTGSPCELALQFALGDPTVSACTDGFHYRKNEKGVNDDRQKCACPLNFTKFALKSGFGLLCLINKECYRFFLISGITLALILAVIILNPAQSKVLLLLASAFKLEKDLSIVWQWRSFSLFIMALLFFSEWPLMFIIRIILRISNGLNRNTTEQSRFLALNVSEKPFKGRKAVVAREKNGKFRRIEDEFGVE